MSNGWRQVTGVVRTRRGQPVSSCHVDVVALTPDAFVLELAVFSDDDGHWKHELQAGAEFDLVAYTRPGRAQGRVRIPAGRCDLDGVEIVIDTP